MDALAPTPVLLTSPLLGHVPHAFTTRQGGFSTGAYASLNFGSPNTLPQSERDSRETIERNLRLVLAKLGCEHRTLSQLHQVHGAHIVQVPAGDVNATPDRYGTCAQGDALITAERASLVGVRVADCGPILVASEDGSLVAAIHAGWRGVVAGILHHTVVAMRAQRPNARFVAAIGPCLGADASEMGEDVAQEILAATQRFSGTAQGVLLNTRSENDRPLVDLVHAMTLQLRAAGVAEIDTSCHACTASDASRFFSHRRDAGHTGRMLALIGPA
jgi:polyphenol oxidase